MEQKDNKKKKLLIAAALIAAKKREKPEKDDQVAGPDGLYSGDSGIGKCYLPEY